MMTNTKRFIAALALLSLVIVVPTKIALFSSSFAAVSCQKPIRPVSTSLSHQEDDTSVKHGGVGACDGFDGVLHIASADSYAATGTLFFLSVLNHIRYAQANNLLPWIHLNNYTKNCYDPDVHGRGPNITFRMQKGAYVSRIPTRGMKDGHECQVDRSFDRSYPGPPIINTNKLEEAEFTVDGNGIWDTYFQPLVPTFRFDDPSCRSKPLIEMPLDEVYPGMHKCAPWAVRSWPYDGIPKYLKPKKEGNKSALQEWFAPMRQWGSEVVQEHYRLQPWLEKAVNEANDPTARNNQTCLAMHVRWTDKSHGRDKVSLDNFLTYAKAFVELGGKSIYLATDDSRVFQEMNRTWPSKVTSIISMQAGVYRSSSSKAVFKLTSAHRANTEALVDIYAMARCSLLLHGLSAMTESVMYLNLDLHNQSVNLDDPDHITVKRFREVVSTVLKPETTAQS